jgi:hypothetical protein
MGKIFIIISACYFFVIYLSAIIVEQRTHAAQLMTAKIGQRKDVTPVATEGVRSCWWPQMNCSGIGRCVRTVSIMIRQHQPELQMLGTMKRSCRMQDN